MSRSVSYLDGRIRLEHKDIESEVASLAAREHDPRFPMRLIGMRARSENSWMHNVPMLMRGGRVQRALIHAYDADQLGVTTDDLLAITSPHGEIELPAQVSKDILPGLWPCRTAGASSAAGWSTANANPGANVNLLMSSRPEDLEALAGMAHLNGVPVRCGARDGAENGTRRCGKETPKILALSLDGGRVRRQSVWQHGRM